MSVILRGPWKHQQEDNLCLIMIQHQLHLAWQLWYCGHTEDCTGCSVGLSCHKVSEPPEETQVWSELWFPHLSLTTSLFCFWGFESAFSSCWDLRLTSMISRALPVNSLFSQMKIQLQLKTQPCLDNISTEEMCGSIVSLGYIAASLRLTVCLFSLTLIVFLNVVLCLISSTLNSHCVKTPCCLDRHIDRDTL